MAGGKNDISSTVAHTVNFINILNRFGFRHIFHTNRLHGNMSNSHHLTELFYLIIYFIRSVLNIFSGAIYSMPIFKIKYEIIFFSLFILKR